MRRYLCPICDLELKGKNYCTTCRRVVRNPVVYDGVLPNEDNGNYLLNHEQIHPGKHCVEANQERTCATPQEKRQAAQFERQRTSGGQTAHRSAAAKTTDRSAAGQTTGSSGTVYQPYRGQQSTAPGSQIWRSGASNTGSSRNTYNSFQKNTDTRKGKKGRRSGCLTIFIIFWIIGIFGNVLSELEIGSWFEDRQEYVTEETVHADDFSVEVSPEFPESAPADAEESVENYYETLDYAEIMAAGERCSGYWHYPAEGTELYKALAEFARTEMGLVMTEESDYMINEAAAEEYGGYTYFDTCHYWDWQDGYLGVGSDSVTGEVHYVLVYGWNADEVIEIILKAFSIVEDEGSADVMRNSLCDAVKKEDIKDGYYFDMGDSSVWICEASEGYYMAEVYPVTE